MSLIKIFLLISYCLTTICSFNFYFSFSSLSFDIKNLEYFNNPYRVLGIAPWSSMKKIRKKYTELAKKKHPDKSATGNREEFEIIQKAFDQIKKERKESEENEEDISFSYVIRNTISKVLHIEIIFAIIYSISHIIYKFQSMVYVPLFYMVLSFTIITNIFPHFFKEELIEYIACAIIGYLLYTRHKKYFRKNENSENNNN